MSSVGVVRHIGVPVGDDQVVSAARVTAESLSSVTDAVSDAAGLVAGISAHVRAFVALLFKVVFRDSSVRFRSTDSRKLVPAIINVVSLPGGVSIVIIGDDAAVLITSIAQDSIVHFSSTFDHRPVIPATVRQRRLHDDFWVGDATAIAPAIAIAEVFAPLWVSNTAAAAIVATTAAAARAGAKVGAPIGITDTGATTLAVFLDTSLKASRLKAKGGCNESNYKFQL